MPAPRYDRIADKVLQGIAPSIFVTCSDSEHQSPLTGPTVIVAEERRAYDARPKRSQFGEDPEHAKAEVWQPSASERESPDQVCATDAARPTSQVIGAAVLVQRAVRMSASGEADGQQSEFDRLRSVEAV